MDNGITLTTPAPFVVNVVQVTGGSAGFDINLAGAKFQILVNLATDGGTSPLVGEEYTSVEKNKLANIEVNAKDDQTGAEIKVLYEGENDTNAFTDLEQAKLGDIEADATADQTGLEIKTAYELEANTNAYTDVEKIKLATIMAGATDDLTGAEIKVLYESEGNTNAYTDTEKTKLSLIEDNATKDQTAAEIESLYGSRVPQVSGQEITDGFEANVRRFSPDQIEAMIVIHAPVIDTLTDQEVEEAYNRQVDQVSGAELAAGTETAVRRVSPADLKTAVLAHETGGGGGDPNPDQVSAQEITDGTETALRSFSPDDIEAMAVIHGGGGGGMSDAAVKIAYENNPDTNEFSDAEKTALGTMESGATADQTDGEIETAYNAQVDKVSGPEIAAGTEVAVRRFSPDDIEAMVVAHAPGGGDFIPEDPTRSTLTVSGADSAIAIPDGCTWFKYDTGFLVASGTDVAPYAGVRHGGTPTDQLFSGVESLIDTALSLSTVVANGAVAVTANDGGGTARSMAGTVWSPRDATKKTMAHGYGIAHGQPKSRSRDLVADAAEDDHTFFISGNNGTVTGSVEIEWFYDGGAMDGAAVRAAVEAAADSNVFTDADHSKLDGIAAGAEVNVADVDFYDLGMDFLGKPTDGQIIARWVVLREITMAANFTGAAGNILVNPTATLAIDIKDDGTTIGTVSISTSGVFTFTTAGGTAKVVAAGSVVTATAPATADTTGSDIVFTLPGAL